MLWGIGSWGLPSTNLPLEMCEDGEYWQLTIRSCTDHYDRLSAWSRFRVKHLCFSPVYFPSLCVIDTRPPVGPAHSEIALHAGTAAAGAAGPRNLLRSRYYCTYDKILQFSKFTFIAKLKPQIANILIVSTRDSVFVILFSSLLTLPCGNPRLKSPSIRSPLARRTETLPGGKNQNWQRLQIQIWHWHQLFWIFLQCWKKMLHKHCDKRRRSKFGHYKFNQRWPFSGQGNRCSSGIDGIEGQKF